MGRGRSWLLEEDVALCRAYAKTTAESPSDFFDRLSFHFAQLAPDHVEPDRWAHRTTKALEKRLKIIRPSVLRFCRLYASAKACAHPADGEADVIAHALTDYAAERFHDKSKPPSHPDNAFKFLECWHTLKIVPLFADACLPKKHQQPPNDTYVPPNNTFPLPPPPSAAAAAALDAPTPTLTPQAPPREDSPHAAQTRSNATAAPADTAPLPPIESDHAQNSIPFAEQSEETVASHPVDQPDADPSFVTGRLLQTVGAGILAAASHAVATRASTPTRTPSLPPAPTSANGVPTGFTDASPTGLRAHSRQLLKRPRQSMDSSFERSILMAAGVHHGVPEPASNSNPRQQHTLQQPGIASPEPATVATTTNINNNNTNLLAMAPHASLHTSARTLAMNSTTGTRQQVCDDEARAANGTIRAHCEANTPGFDVDGWVNETASGESAITRALEVAEKLVRVGEEMCAVAVFSRPDATPSRKSQFFELLETRHLELAKRYCSRK